MKRSKEVREVLLFLMFIFAAPVVSGIFQFGINGAAGDLSSIGRNTVVVEWVSPDGTNAVIRKENGVLRFVDLPPHSEMKVGEKYQRVIYYMGRSSTRSYLRKV